VVLASDCSHYYEHMETGRVFPTAFHLGEMVEGYDKLRARARPVAAARHSRSMTSGSWPRYPAPTQALEGIAVRLDVPPK
jgi:hypothetical protein